MKAWKLQKFAEDVVYDLRNRGLLPLALLLVVAMVAFPFLITRMGGDEPASAPPPPAESAAELAPENQTAVVAYNPSIRDYKERLDEMQSKNPFIQQFTAPPVGTTDLEQSGLETGVTELEGGGGSPGLESGAGEVSDTTTTKSGKIITRYFFYETDVLVGEAGRQLVRRNRIQIFDYLPNAAMPVLSFMGYTGRGAKAVFLVSRDVTVFDGPGSCFPSPEECQLLALKPGQAENLTWAPEGAEAKTVRVKVLRIKLRITKKPPR